MIGQAIAHTANDLGHGLLLVVALLALYFLVSVVASLVWGQVVSANDGMEERRRLSEPVDLGAEIRVRDLSRRGPGVEAR